MKVKMKGLFQALPNCLTLEEIVEYLDMRNYNERKKQEEYHEMYNDGSIILDNHINVTCETKDRAQIFYTEFERHRLLTNDYILHQPSWLIVPNTNSNDVWVRGSVVCYFSQNEELMTDPFVGQFRCKKKIKRTYSGSIHCPYTELSTERLESMLTESLKKLQYMMDEVALGDIKPTDKYINNLPIIMND